MKTDTKAENSTKKKLDIRFISIDSENPFVIGESFSDEHAGRIVAELHDKLGHLSHDIGRTSGHINIYTCGNSVVGEPQLVNFSKDVWYKINYPAGHDGDLKLKNAGNGGDYLDHENYNDL